MKKKNVDIEIMVPQKIKDILQKLTKAGYEAFVVGGCVRDVMMNKQPKDWDVTTNARPDDIQHLFEHTIETGKAYGTITVVYQGGFCEVTTFRHESDYVDYRHPKKVWFSNKLEEDLKRRDFTVNAMACDQHGTLIDLFGGRNDINHRVLRCVGEAKERFREDPLRILRAVRFAVACGFDVEQDTEQALIQQAGLLQHVSMERCRDELIKMLDINALDAVEMLYHYQVLSILFAGLIKFRENHCLESLRHANTVDECFVIILRNLVFDMQENAAENCYKQQLRHLKLSEKDVIRISKAAVCEFKEAYRDVVEVRKGLANYGVDVFQLAARAWRLENETQNICHTIDTVIKNGECISIKQLAVNGRDLIKLGYEPNEQLGGTLKELLDIVLKEPKKNKKEQLLMIAKQAKEQDKH